LDIETRLHPRTPVDWHAFIKTFQGSISVKTRDVSVDGACILCPADLELEKRFSIFLKPPRAKPIRVIAETVWSDKFNPENREVFRMGMRFLAISPEDQQFLESFVEIEKWLV
jgi:c-di-GMP-binding flagellar brake protein YcgR